MKISPLLLTAMLGLIAAVALAAYLVFDSGSGDSPTAKSFRGCTPEESATQQAYEALPTPTQILPGMISAEELNRLSREQAGVPFEGQLCDFEVVSLETLPWRDCVSGVEQRGGESRLPILDSELNRGEVWEQAVCGGTPTAAFGPNGRRAYFKDEARVYASRASREHIRVIDVDGHPVLLALPPIQIGSISFHIIERLPSGDTPGILISGDFANNIEQAIERARAALAE